MGRREWIVITLCAAALVGIVIVIVLNRPDPAVNKLAANPDDETYLRMTGDPNKEVEDQTVIFVAKLGGTIVRLQGYANFQPVYEVSFRDQPVTDADLAELAGLKNLRKIDLSGTKVTDAGVKFLLFYRYLEVIDLSRTAVTGAGLSELTALNLVRRVVLAGSKATNMGLRGLTGVPNTVELDLSDTEVTNAGIDRLKVLPRLDVLNLARTKITGRGVPELRELGVAEMDVTGIPLSTEEYLSLLSAKPRKDPSAPPPGGPIRVAPQPTKLTLRGANRAITDEAIQTLAKRNDLGLLVTTLSKIIDPELPKIDEADEDSVDKSVLDLSGSQVTDAGLKLLGDLTTLRRLLLKGTAVTDAGLKHLAAIANLRVLDLRNTKVTDVGVAELKSLLPRCAVAR